MVKINKYNDTNILVVIRAYYKKICSAAMESLKSTTTKCYADDNLDTYLNQEENNNRANNIL